jgi:hypothetical protein
MTDPPLILHYHLFKNAGTSVDAILRANFGLRWRSHDPPDPEGSVFGRHLDELLLSSPDLVAVSSHQFRAPVCVATRPALPIVFLRHPLDRLRSMYQYDRDRAPVTRSAAIASTHGFAAYVRLLLSDLRILGSNAQVKLLSDGRDARGCLLALGPERHLARARAFLDSVPVVGVVERYHQSWAQLTPIIRRYWPDFAADIGVAHNVDATRAETLEDRLAAMRDELGADLYRELEDANQLDEDLRQWAIARLDR